MDTVELSKQLELGDFKLWYIHKYEEQLLFGGREEGGWYYTRGTPTDFTFGPFFATEESAYDQCRVLNELENERRHREERYDYHSVLAAYSTFYSYDVSEDSEPHEYPSERPHYE